MIETNEHNESNKDNEFSRTPVRDKTAHTLDNITTALDILTERYGPTTERHAPACDESPELFIFDVVGELLNCYPRDIGDIALLINETYSISGIPVGSVTNIENLLHCVKTVAERIAIDLKIAQSNETVVAECKDYKKFEEPPVTC